MPGAEHLPAPALFPVHLPHIADRNSSVESPASLKYPSTEAKPREHLFILRQGRQFGLRYVEISIDVLDVFMILQFIHEPQHLFSLFPGELHV